MKKTIRIKVIILILLIFAGILTCIKPIYPKEMFLQHIGSIILVMILMVDIRKNYLFLSSFIGISLFTFLHIIAARYLYTYFPYNEWILNLSGRDVDAYFGFERNQFDRLVHFLFGIFIFPYAMQVFAKWKGVSKIHAVIIAWLAIQTFSMIYELFEWALTFVMSANAIENYNGQQGDWWDAQKDMALAMLGSTIIGSIYIIKYKNKCLI